MISKPLKLKAASLIAITLSAIPLGLTQDLESALPNLESDKDEAIAAYQEILDEINSEKLELVRQTNSLDRAVIQKKEELRELALQVAEREEKKALAEETLTQLENVSGYIDGVLRDFSSKFLSRIDFSEQQKYLKELTEINEALRLETGSYDQNIESQLKVVEHSIDLLKQSIGGYRIKGAALSEEGLLKEGTLIRVGPSSYFSSTDETVTGLLIPNVGTIEPKVITLSPAQNDNIAALITSNEGSLPVDSSQNALKLNQERGSTLQHLQKGGWVGYVIISLGAISSLLVIAKILSIKREEPRIPNNLSAIVSKAKSGDAEAAIGLVQNVSSSVKTILHTGVHNTRQTIDLLEESLLSDVLEYKLKLERFIPILALTAATAPLLGLLGTVVGMIKTFTLITVFGTGDAKSLSSGISEALVTTELGLIIAVPALIFHGLVLHMIQTRTATMERIAFEFVKEVKRTPEDQ